MMSPSFIMTDNVTCNHSPCEFGELPQEVMIIGRLDLGGYTL